MPIPVTPATMRERAEILLLQSVRMQLDGTPSALTVAELARGAALALLRAAACAEWPEEHQQRKNSPPKAGRTGEQ